MHSGMMLTLIVADAELETIPVKMQNDEALRKYAKNKKKPVSEVLLDSNYMHTSIDRYFPGESNRRGRPDIIYLLLQVVMESILNKSGKLRVYIHTRNDLCITVNPEVRLPKSYNRFVGLVESLFRNKEISSDGKVLLELEELHIGDLVSKVSEGRVIIFSPDGEKARIGDLLSTSDDCTVIIGGFSEGDFISDVYSLSKAYSIFPEELTIWSVAAEVLAQCERTLDLV